MSAAPSSSPAIAWDGARLTLLDQTLLPDEERWIALHGAADTARAIARLAVRGAPNIGIAAAYGLAMEIERAPGDEELRAAARVLREARPTAVNLAWAVDRVAAAALSAPHARRAAVARTEAESIHAREDAASLAIALAGADLLAGSRRILTHCNTGALACGGTGSALAVALELAARQDGVTVLACETRPLLQGARLTVWELRRAGVPHELLVDGAAAGLMRRGDVDAVIVGCDRVAANGDVANKVGTYAHALAARAAQIPFVVAGPTSTIDPAIATGDEVVIEERAADEVRRAGGALLAPADTPCRNPAFDVTPAELVTARVTERGIASPPTTESVAALLAPAADAA
ncbi:MAG TPA: S-methyl-5-thioribose-1-phosphate isomerase [Solirubrobacteraceae bacterium]|nr:S-methyl-5-thioribose-1-phosphate isomerase [Solirubrobacteraceae bacterium]